MSWTNRNCENKFFENFFEESLMSDKLSQGYKKKTQTNEIIVNSVQIKHCSNIYEDTQQILCSLINQVFINSKENDQKDEDLNSLASSSELSEKLTNTSIAKSGLKPLRKKKVLKNRIYRFEVPPRHGKCNKKTRLIRKGEQQGNLLENRNTKESRKKSSVKENVWVEKRFEIPKKGKRGCSGGKAKGNPPRQDSKEKCDNDSLSMRCDADNDSLYFYRISLGQFQELKDESGASTSSEWKKDYYQMPSLSSRKELECTSAEEAEFLELQRWGRTTTVSPQEIIEEKDRLGRNQNNLYNSESNKANFKTSHCFSYVKSLIQPTVILIPT